MKEKTLKKLKMNTALVLAAALTMGFPVPAAAYDYSADETMYLTGVRQTAKSDGNSYTLVDVDENGTDELLTASADGKYGRLSIWLYDKKAKTAKRKATLKQAAAVFHDEEEKKLIVEKKNTPKDTYVEYSVKGSKLVKKTVYKAVKSKKTGKTLFYKNKKKITAKQYRKYASSVGKKQELTLINNTPWVDSDVIGAAGAAGKQSGKDDFHLASNYDYFLGEHIKTSYETDYFINHLQENVDSRIEEMFTDRVKYPSEKSRGLTICRDYYDFATNWEKRDSDGVEPLRKYVEGIKDATTLEDLKQLIADPSRSPFTNLVKAKVDLSGTDNLDWTLGLDSDEFSVNAYTLKDAEAGQEQIDMQRESFAAVNIHVLSKLGYGKEEINRILSECYEMEQELSASVNDYTNEEIEELLTTFTSYEELCGRITQFPLKEILSGIGVTGGRVALSQPDYLAALDAYFTSAHVSRIQSYLIAHNVFQAADYLDVETAAISYGYEASEVSRNREEIIEMMESGAKEEATDNGVRTFVGADSGPFSVAVQDAYMDFFVEESTRQKLTALVEKCKDAFRTMLAGEAWMSEAGRTAAVEKLDNMTFFVMKPDEQIDPSYLAIDNTRTFLDAMIKFRESKARHNCEYVGQKVDRTKWCYDLMPGNGPTKVNAEYLPDLNQFYIYAGIVGEDTFTAAMTKEEQLGRLGNIIGHEMTHGFDPRGSKYDKYGSLVATKEHPNGWFTDEDYQAYQERIKKVERFYDSLLTIPGVQLKGSNLYGEAVADMGGMAIGLNIAKRQKDFDYKAYFSAYADMWKRQNSLTTELSNLDADAHPPVYLRVNVTLQQFDEFLDTYGIEKGDGMYLRPEDRLVVW